MRWSTNQDNNRFDRRDNRGKENIFDINPGEEGVLGYSKHDTIFFIVG